MKGIWGNKPEIFGKADTAGVICHVADQINQTILMIVSACSLGIMTVIFYLPDLSTPEPSIVSCSSTSYGLEDISRFFYLFLRIMGHDPIEQFVDPITVPPAIV